MANGINGSNGISSATLSKLAIPVISLILAAAATWTTIQLTLQKSQLQMESTERKNQFQSDLLERRIAALEEAARVDRAEQMKELKEANRQLREIKDGQRGK